MYILTHTEVTLIKDALDRTSDEFEYVEEEGHVLNSGAKEEVQEALEILNALILQKEKEDMDDDSSSNP